MRIVCAAVRVRAVFEERYWYPDDGGQVWLAGYTLVDDEGRYLARDAQEVLSRGLHVVAVAGAHHRAEALATAPADPARRSSCAATRPTSTTRTRSRCWPEAS